jgi:hypothetical protein
LLISIKYCIIWASSERSLVPGFLALLIVITLQAPHREPPTTYTKEEALLLGHQLIAAIDPAKPENGYMPPLLREKIAWVFSEFNKGTLRLTIGAEKGEYLMGADATSKTDRWIFVNSSRLMGFARGDLKLREGYNDFLKDTFATALAHEAIHLEVIPLPRKDFATTLREEERAWRKATIEIVRPLRAQGRKVLRDFARADDILLAGKDRLPCPKFTTFLKQGRVKIK